MKLVLENRQKILQKKPLSLEKFLLKMLTDLYASQYLFVIAEGSVRVG